MITLDELTLTELCSILILKVQSKSSSNIYFENLFNHDDIDWTANYVLQRLVTHNTYMRPFQYKILNNILCLNKKLHTFGIKSSPLWSFCNLHDETPFHIFCECDRVTHLWSDLIQCFQNTFILPNLTPQSVILGIFDSVGNNSYFLRTIQSLSNVLIFKLYVINHEKKNP